MRYRDNSLLFHIMIIGMWTALVVLYLLSSLHSHSKLDYAMLVVFSVNLILEIATYRFCYTEICDRSLIRRSLFGRKEQIYERIIYIGPVTGKWANWYSTDQQIEVRTDTNIKCTVRPKQREAFLAELHRHLAEEVFHLDQAHP